MRVLRPFQIGIVAFAGLSGLCLLLDHWTSFSALAGGDVVEIEEIGEGRHSPSIVLRIPIDLRYRSSVGQTKTNGINIITFYPDFTSLADPRNAIAVDCVGYCNGRMVISIANVPVEWSALRPMRTYDNGYLGALEDHKPIFAGVQLEDLQPILGFDRVFEQKIANSYTERVLLKVGDHKSSTDLTAECSMSTAVQVCQLSFELACAPVVDITVSGWRYDHLSDAFELQRRVDKFVSEMMVQPKCQK